jgi:hypothetical protein
VGLWLKKEEKLATVGVGPGVSHRQHTRLVVLEGKVLILKLFAVNRLAA